MFLLYRINIPTMEEIGVPNPKYQPQRILWRSIVRPRSRNHPFQSNQLITRELVSSLFPWTISWSWSKSVSPVLWYILIKLPSSPQKFLRGSRFFFYFLTFFHFHRTLFVGLRDPGDFNFQNTHFVHSLVCLIIHSFLDGFQPNLHQHFSYVCSTSQRGFSLK